FCRSYGHFRYFANSCLRALRVVPSALRRGNSLVARGWPGLPNPRVFAKTAIARSRKPAGLAKAAKPFHEKAIQVKADVAAFLKIIASVWLHDSTPTHGRRQPAAAPTQVCVCMGPLSLISGRGSERPGDVKSARSGRGAANP